MNTDLHLAPFEEQVMEVICYAVLDDESLLHDCMHAHDLHRYGCGLFGKDWTVKRPTRIPFEVTFPPLDGALGRLRRKGLLERKVWSETYANQHRGLWSLTELGRELLGLEPIDDSSL